MNNEHGEGTSGGGGGGSGGGGEEVSTTDGDSTDNAELRTCVDGTWISAVREELPGERRGRADGHPTYSSYFDEHSTLSSEERKEAAESRLCRILEKLRESTGVYASDVYECRNDECAEAFCKRMQSICAGFSRGLLIVSQHGSHVHVVHDCASSNGSCRCHFAKQAKILARFRRRSIRRRPLSSSLTLSKLRNIIKYFSEEGKGRRMSDFRVGGRVQRPPIEACVVVSGGHEGEAEGCGMEALSETDDVELRVRNDKRPNDIRGGENDREGDAELPKAKWRKTKRLDEKIETILDLFKMNPMCPMQGLLQHSVWLEHPEFKYLDGNDDQVKLALNNWSKRLCNWSTEMLWELYSAPGCNHIFSAGIRGIDEYYYSVEDSYDKMLQLLMFQFHDDSEQVANFVTDLYNVAERIIPKLNTILVHSPPSSGKNYFFDSIIDYYLNIGHLCRANKHSAFPFQDAESKRFMMWNEPNYAPEFIEVLKELLGGDSTNVSVKYKPEVPVYRTPFIVLTNDPNLSIIRAPAFADRMRVFKWRQAPYLKEFKKYLHPLATYKLFATYGLVK